MKYLKGLVTVAVVLLTLSGLTPLSSPSTAMAQGPLLCSTTATTSMVGSTVFGHHEISCNRNVASIYVIGQLSSWIYVRNSASRTCTNTNRCTVTTQAAWRNEGWVAYTKGSVTDYPPGGTTNYDWKNSGSPRYYPNPCGC